MFVCCVAGVLAGVALWRFTLAPPRTGGQRDFVQLARGAFAGVPVQELRSIASPSALAANKARTDDKIEVMRRQMAEIRANMEVVDQQQRLRQCDTAVPPVPTGNVVTPGTP